MIDDVLEIAADTVRSWRAEPALKLADYLAELSRFLPPGWYRPPRRPPT